MHRQQLFRARPDFLSRELRVLQRFILQQMQKRLLSEKRGMHPMSGERNMFRHRDDYLQHRIPSFGNGNNLYGMFRHYRCEWYMHGLPGSWQYLYKRVLLLRIRQIRHNVFRNQLLRHELRVRL